MKNNKELTHVLRTAKIPFIEVYCGGGHILEFPRPVLFLLHFTHLTNKESMNEYVQTITSIDNGTVWIITKSGNQDITTETTFEGLALVNHALFGLTLVFA